MAIKLSDLLKNPKLLDEVRNSREEVRDGHYVRDVCGNWELSDDYYERISDLIEQCPPTRPGIRRG